MKFREAHIDCLEGGPVGGKKLNNSNRVNWEGGKKLGPKEKLHDTVPRVIRKSTGGGAMRLPQRFVSPKIARSPIAEGTERKGNIVRTKGGMILSKNLEKTGRKVQRDGKYNQTLR